MSKHSPSPAGQQPHNGDSYFDVLTGATTNFTVTTNAPTFTLSIPYKKGTGNKGELSEAVLDRFDPARFNATVTTPGEYYLFRNTTGAPVVVTAGLFAGKTIPANTDVALVWSGDPDSDNSGWIWHQGATDATLTTNTPHAQVVPDTITTQTVYGFERDFILPFMPAGLADDDVVQLVRKIPNIAGVIKCELIEISDQAGSLYEFEIRDVFTGNPTLIPQVISINPARNFITDILLKADGAGEFSLYVKVKAGASGLQYRLEFTSEDVDLNPLIVTVTTSAATAFNSTMKANEKYPSDSFTNFVKAASGDATAQVPPGVTIGSRTTNVELPTPAGKRSRFTGFVGGNGDAAGVRPYIQVKNTTSTDVDVAAINWARYLVVNGGGANKSSIAKGDMLKANNQLYISDGPFKQWWQGVYTIIVDRRHPSADRFDCDIVYTDNAGVVKHQRTQLQLQRTVAGIDSIVFPDFGQDSSWEIYREI